MATPRPYKQLSLLSLVSSLQGDRGLLPRSLAVTLFELPPLPPSPAPPSPLPATAAKLRAFPPAGRAQGSGKPAARCSGGGPRTRASRLPGGTVFPPRSFLSRLLQGIGGSRDVARGAGAKAGSGLRLRNRVLGVSFLSSGLRVALPHVSAACRSLPTQSVGSGARGQVRLSGDTCPAGPQKGLRQGSQTHPGG